MNSRVLECIDQARSMCNWGWELLCMIGLLYHAASSFSLVCMHSMDIACHEKAPVCLTVLIA